MSTINILFFAGSARRDSFNKKLAHLGARIAEENGLAATSLDLRDYPMPLYDGDLEDADGAPQNASKLNSVISSHQGIFIASPEYNSSISPLLKNTIDWLSRLADPGTGKNVFYGRVFALGSATAGTSGGVRSMLALRQVLVSGIGGFVIPEQMSVPSNDQAFDETGRLKDVQSETYFLTVIKRLEETTALLKDTPVSKP